MGYTHYWESDQRIEGVSFNRIVSDCNKIILPLSNIGVHLAGPLGHELPEITTEQIAFNGVYECEHPENRYIVIPYPDKAAWGVGESERAIAEYAFMHTLLRWRTCNGHCSYESVIFERISQRPVDPKTGKCSDYCKTGFRPYDLALQCLLLIAKHYLAQSVRIWSDGLDKLWREAREFCYLHLNYRLLEFRIDSEGELVESEDLPS